MCFTFVFRVKSCVVICFSSPKKFCNVGENKQIYKRDLTRKTNATYYIREKFYMYVVFLVDLIASVFIVGILMIRHLHPVTLSSRPFISFCHSQLLLVRAFILRRSSSTSSVSTFCEPPMNRLRYLLTISSCFYHVYPYHMLYPSRSW